MDEPRKIIVEKNGPYRVSEGIPLERETVVGDENNDPVDWEKREGIETEGDYYLCRCGKSHDKPFCDKTHESINFDGTETASRESYKEQADVYRGPELDLMDAGSLCARARFCHRCKGTWTLTENSDNPEAKKVAIDEACKCASGRLTAVDKKSGEPIEPEFDQAISVTEDVPAGVSGPLWAKGGIVVESHDGKKYEARNRQTLCRCGNSRNKPFCDGSHIDVGFNDKE